MLLTEYQLVSNMLSSDSHAYKYGEKKDLNINQFFSPKVADCIVYRAIEVLNAFKNKEEIYNKFIKNSNLIPQEEKTEIIELVYKHIDFYDLYDIYKNCNKNADVWALIDNERENCNFKNITKFLLSDKFNEQEKQVFFEVGIKPEKYNELSEEYRSNPYIAFVYLKQLENNRKYNHEKKEFNIAGSFGYLEVSDMIKMPYRNKEEILHYMETGQRKSFDVTQKDIDAFFKTEEEHVYQEEVWSNGYTNTATRHNFNFVSPEINKVPLHFWESKEFLNQYNYLNLKYTKENHPLTLQDKKDLMFLLQYKPEVQDKLSESALTSMLKYQKSINANIITREVKTEAFPDFDAVCKIAKEKAEVTKKNNAPIKKEQIEI